VALYAAVAAFLTYTSVYAFRKPFTVATFEGEQFLGISYQSLLIISQVIGYMLSKFYGIRFIAELKRVGRWKTIALVVSIAWLCFLFFALVPPPYGIPFLFINGFVLGLLWGVIFSYIEGRRATDFIGAAMAVSFIFAGGFTRSVAKWLMIEWGVSEQWMPFMTGVVFALPLVLFTFMMERIPPPAEEDLKERTPRQPMDRAARKSFLKQFGWGMAIVTIIYIFLTVMRDIRDSYMANIWNELGYGTNYSIFTKTETTTSLIILVMMALLVLVRKNMLALRLVHWIIGAGLLLTLISSWLFINGMLDGAIWMQLTGLGLYMGYIPFNCIFFERFIATFKIAGNVGFLIYIADAYGYAGSVSIILSKEFFKQGSNWAGLYSIGVVVLSLLGLTATILSFIYFNKKYRTLKTA
jgi:hypothetical protein